MQNDSALRAIATRLTVTPVEDLPRIAGFLATSLGQCSVEAQFSDIKTSGSSSVTAHKLKTRITSLLQDRSTAGRFSATVLIKAIVDGGGSNVLSTSEVWARGLLTCLNKPDPVHVKKLYLASVTRIFLLTRHIQTLQREITTPLLPAFITACLSLIRPIKAQVGASITEVASPLLDPVLHCWVQLLPQHATIFRPFLARIRLLGQRLLEDSTTVTSSRDLATRLMCLLISCAPKNTASQEWTQTAAGIIGSAHQTADQLFRAVIEVYEPNDITNQKPSGKCNFSTDPKISDKDQLGLGAWTGISEGGSRLVTVIDWLIELVSLPTVQNVTIPVGSILDLTSRILAVIPPDSKTNAAAALRYHNEASREEKEQLWLNLPQIHTSCLHLLETMIKIHGQSILPAFGPMFNQIMESFEVMSKDGTIRQVVYKIFSDVLGSVDLKQLKLSRTGTSLLIDRCCNDLNTCLPATTDLGNPKASKEGFLSIKPVSVAQNHVLQKQFSVFEAAWTLLPEIIIHCPSSLISSQSRLVLDRLSVLLDHKDAMLASVMCPMVSDQGKATTASLLPFLARSAADSITTEALLRPRVTVTQIGADSAQVSRNEELLISDEQHEEQDGQDDDILSRLEDSLDTMKETVGSEEPTPAYTSSFPEGENFQDELISANKKRAYEDIERNEENLLGANTQLSSLRSPKIPRLQEVTMEGFSSPEAERTVTRPEQYQDSTTNELLSSGSMLKEASYPESAVNVAATNDNSDDSEIPQIDPGFDTDEEESG